MVTRQAAGLCTRHPHPRGHFSALTADHRKSNTTDEAKRAEKTLAQTEKFVLTGHAHLEMGQRLLVDIEAVA